MAPAPAHRIVIVDDNRQAADTAALLLRQNGREVRTAYDGPSALTLAAEFRPQVVFLDLLMPGLDGLAVAKLLRQIPGLQSARIVALTGHGQPEITRATRAAGFDGHLLKPASIEDLLPYLA